MMRISAMLLLLALALPCAGARGAGCPNPQDGIASVYLVQNSGWMEPFYVDPQSPFRALVQTLIDRSSAGGDTVIADFNQNGQIVQRTSPRLYYCGRPDPASTARAVGEIDLPRQGGRLTDADFDGALVRAINEVLNGQQGIIWIVTNNKNSPNNSQLVNDNTRAFAARLSNTADLPTVVAYPIRMPVQGRLYAEKGLIIYGIAHGPQAAARLVEAVQSQGMQQLFPDPPVRLKPLSTSPLVFTPTSTSPGDMTVAVAPDGTLVVDGVPGGRESQLQVEGNLTSEYYPQVIDTADVHVAWRALDGVQAGEAVQGAVAPAELHRLAPRDVLPNVHIMLNIPSVARAAGLAGLWQKDETVGGTLAISLTGMKLTLSDQFREKMAQISALDQLPAVFFDYTKVANAETLVPVRLRVRFSAFPLVAALGAVAAIAAGLMATALLMRRERLQRAIVGGQDRRIRLRAFESRLVTLPDGRMYRVRGSLFGRASVTEIDRSKKT